MELFDLVDENDNVIGTTDKQTAHKNAGIHRVAAIYVFTEDGKLYMQEHIKSGGKFDHSVGGHVAKGEAYDEAAKREAFEELGITDPLTKISIFYSDETFRWPMRHMIGLYECTPSKNWRFTSNEEVKNILPMAIPDIVDTMNKQPEKFTGGFLKTMTEYIKQKNLPYHVILK